MVVGSSRKQCDEVFLNRHIWSLDRQCHEKKCDEVFYGIIQSILLIKPIDLLIESIDLLIESIDLLIESIDLLIESIDLLIKSIDVY